MEWKDALSLAREGVKITHKYFLLSEYLTAVGNYLHFEDGVIISIHEFFKIRCNGDWFKDWSVYDKS